MDDYHSISIADGRASFGQQECKRQSFYYYFLGFPASSPHPIEISKQNRFEEGKKIQKWSDSSFVLFGYTECHGICLLPDAWAWKSCFERLGSQWEADSWRCRYLMVQKLAFANFSSFLSMLSFYSTALHIWLYFADCWPAFAAILINPTSESPFWIHFVRCMGIGDGGQSIETCWSYMSNPVQLCFHNIIPDKYLRSQNQCHKNGEHSKESAQWTAHFSDLCSVLHFPRRATVLVTLKNQKKTKFFQDNQPRQRKTTQKKTPRTAFPQKMWRVAPHLSPMFSRVYQPRWSIAPWIRGVASEIAASETTSSLLSQIQGDGNDGKVQSCTGGLLRLQLGDLFFFWILDLLCFFFWGGRSVGSWLSFFFCFCVWHLWFVSVFRWICFEVSFFLGHHDVMWQYHIIHQIIYDIHLKLLPFQAFVHDENRGPCKAKSL